MANPNVVGTTTLTFKSAKAALTTSAVSMISNAASSGIAIKIVSLYVANIDATASADVTISVYDQAAIAGTATALVSTVAVAADTTIVIIDDSSPVYLTENMSLGGLASATGDLVYVASYQEIS